MVHPSGEQVDLAFEDQLAVVTQVGATLRSYDVRSVRVIDGFGMEEMASSGRGQVLAPWPNRLQDGEYVFEGVSGHAAIDEPERHNAIHGLVRWLAWRIGERTASTVRMSCRLCPQPAYPFHLDLELAYSLSPAGLSVTVLAGNPGATRIPFGIGFHPYVTAGTSTVDSALLRLSADHRILVDGRGLPTGREEVVGTPYDFREPLVIAARRLDDCFVLSGSVAGAGARVGAGEREAWVEDPRAGGRRVGVWAQEGFGYFMCYTGDTLGDVGSRRRSIAIEPMTCPPNAFRSGEGLIVLDPGAHWSASWGIWVRQSHVVQTSGTH